MSNRVIPKTLLNHKIYTKPEFQEARSPVPSISLGSLSPQSQSKSSSQVHLTSSPIDLPFGPVKLRLASDVPDSTTIDVSTKVVEPYATIRGKKLKMSVKIQVFKGLKNGIENPKEFLEKLNWIYKREHKADEPASAAEKAEYISETRRILFRSHLERKAELWYSRLPQAIKEN